MSEKTAQDVEEIIEKKRSERELREIEDDEAADDAIVKLRTMLGGATKGYKILIKRNYPPYAQGPVQELDYEPDADVSWDYIESQFGGGKYQIVLLDERRRFRGSTSFPIPGFPKYMGKTVTCEMDMVKAVREATGEAAAPPDSHNEMDKIYALLLENQNQQARMQMEAMNRQNEMIMNMIKEMRESSNRPSPEGSNPMEAVNAAMAMTQSMLKLAANINEMKPEGEAAGGESEMAGYAEIIKALSGVAENIFRPNPQAPMPPGYPPQMMPPKATPPVMHAAPRAPVPSPVHSVQGPPAKPPMSNPSPVGPGGKSPEEIDRIIKDKMSENASSNDKMNDELDELYLLAELEN